MSFILNISEALASSIEVITQEKIKAINDKISVLEQEKLAFMDLLSDIQKQKNSISELKQSNIDTDEIVDRTQLNLYESQNSLQELNYPHEESFPKQARFILQANGKPMTTAEIVDTIIKNMPSMANKNLFERAKERSRVMVSISGSLGDDANKHKKYFYKINNKVKGKSKYGLLVWKENKQ
jgi:hypothetical protein